MNCPQCNSPLPTDATGGLCPACLFKRGLEPNTVPPTAPAAPWTPPTLDELAPFFPDLDLLSLLGRGGMGAVYKARQKSLDRIIALKILPPQLAADPSFPQRFTHEAQALAKLNHPHIVTIYDFGQRALPVSSVKFQEPVSPPLETRHSTLETIFFLSMEYIDGLSLRQLLSASRLDPNTALAVVPQICDALQYAHDRGIVHRDIKPENILLTQTGAIKIADFGLAKLVRAEEKGLRTEPGPLSPQHSVLSTSPAGTPQYMAPEQSTSPDMVDHRADIYALGVVFYQMLTGELPTGKFDAPSKKVHIDVRLDEIVLRALEKCPDLRYQNATQFKTEIETVVASQSAPPPRGAANASQQAEIPLSPPRLSSTALSGAILGPTILALGFFIPAITGPVSNANTWAMLLVRLMQLLFFATAAGVTLLGLLALVQIRRSQGRLYGRPLALFDALLFPLLALDALIGFLLFNAGIAFLGWSRNYSDIHNSQLIIATVLISAIVDLLVIFLAWRSLRASPAIRSESPLSGLASPRDRAAVPPPITSIPPSVAGFPRATTRALLITLLLHTFLLIAVVIFFCYCVPLFRPIFKDFRFTLLPLTGWVFDFSNFISNDLGCFILPALFVLDITCGVALNFLLGRLALRIWSRLCIATVIILFILSAFGLALPMTNLNTAESTPTIFVIPHKIPRRDPSRDYTLVPLDTRTASSHFSSTVPAGDDAANVKLQAAEEAFKRAKSQHDAGLIDALQFLKAKFDHDLAIASLDPEHSTAGDVRFQYAQDKLHLIAAQYKVGLATAQDLEDATYQLELAKIEGIANSPQAAQELRATATQAHADRLQLISGRWEVAAVDGPGAAFFSRTSTLIFHADGTCVLSYANDNASFHWKLTGNLVTCDDPATGKKGGEFLLEKNLLILRMINASNGQLVVTFKKSVDDTTSSPTPETHPLKG